MKNTKFIKQIAVCIVAVMLPFSGCDTEELHDLNVNPNAQSTVNMNFLFTAAELSTACNGAGGDTWYVNWRTNIGTCAYAIQQLSTTATSGIGQGDKYWDNQEAYNAPWDWYYQDQLKNLDEVIRQTGPGGFEEGRRKNTREAARILRVVNFHRLTDWYGNIPYTEANKGITGIYFPKYDDQEAIYADMLKELDEATTAISASNADDGFTSSDMIYKGDIAKWKKWGYSLMLRLAMRISNVDEAKAATYVSKAVAGGVFTSNDDNPIIGMSSDNGSSNNGLSRAFIDGSHPRTLSKTLVDMLLGTNKGSAADDDPRLLIISGGVDGNVNPLAQAGMPNGLDVGTLDAYTGQTGTNITATFSAINSKFLDRDEPYMMMSHSEVEFLMAEALERSIGTVTGTAQEHYDRGVKSAMQMYTVFDASLTVSDAAVVTYLGNYPYTGTTDEKLEMIGNQMWISKFLNWWEAWSDWRRTGYPVLVPINYPGNLTGGVIPTKLKLPNHEEARNPANKGEGETKPDTQIGKVWWDN